MATNTFCDTEESYEDFETSPALISWETLWPNRGQPLVRSRGTYDAEDEDDDEAAMQDLVLFRGNLKLHLQSWEARPWDAWKSACGCPSGCMCVYSPRALKKALGDCGCQADGVECRECFSENIRDFYGQQPLCPSGDVANSCRGEFSLRLQIEIIFSTDGSHSLSWAHHQPSDSHPTLEEADEPIESPSTSTSAGTGTTTTDHADDTIADDAATPVAEAAQPESPFVGTVTEAVEAEVAPSDIHHDDCQHHHQDRQQGRTVKRLCSRLRTRASALKDRVRDKFSGLKGLFKNKSGV